MKMKSFLIKTRFFLFIAVILILFQPDLNAKTVMGIVIDKSTGKPITDALVILLNNEKIYATAIVDTAGMFFFTNVEIEEFNLWTKRMGYAQIKTGPFQLTKLNILNLVIKMETADIIMSEIVIDEKTFDAYLDKVGYESRKHGPGKYLTYKDIMNKPHANVPTILKNIPNIIITWGIGGSRIYSARYAWQAYLMPEDVNKNVVLKTTTGLSLYIDGMYEPDHNIINVLDPQEIAGIEFYGSRNFAPMQYGGGGGSLLIWTKK
ncbi:MAG: hypothetical protein HY963_03690 [Ignavibacteriales bacterium]|nr:hypothetical protein [Ignavibacteriales bacterium]